ncbi:MAG: hypothetical protein AAFY50_00865 [Cyanobacteria bacterium J06648_1]
MSIEPISSIDMVEYLTTGAGRYATPSIFPLVDKFFDLDVSDVANRGKTSQAVMRGNLSNIAAFSV